MTVSRTKKGFTLVELLVVVSIIGLLSSVVIATIQDARAKNDDTQRNAVAEEYQKALALYYSDYGSYPYPTTTDGNWYCLGDYADGFCGFMTSANPAGLIPVNSQVSTVLSPKYFSKLPSTKPFAFDFLGDLETFEGPIYKCFNYSSITPPVCSEGLLQWMLNHSSSKCIQGAQQTSWGGDPLGITCNLQLK